MFEAASFMQPKKGRKGLQADVCGPKLAEQTMQVLDPYLGG
jgi:hypothetical protein